MGEPQKMYRNMSNDKKTYNRRKALKWYTNGQIVCVYAKVGDKWKLSAMLHNRMTAEAEKII